MAGGLIRVEVSDRVHRLQLSHAAPALRRSHRADSGICQRETSGKVKSKNFAVLRESVVTIATMN